jgi:hypothetical protein
MRFHTTLIYLIMFNCHSQFAVATSSEDPEKCDCKDVEVIVGSEKYTTLEDREIGSPLLDKNGEPVIWQHSLPFFAQDVLDLGFELPNTYGIAIIPNKIEQDIILSNLKLGANNNELSDVEFVQFGTGKVDNKNVQIKVDAWIFPFLNVYATYGKMRGSTDIPVGVEGKGLLELLGIDCTRAIFQEACSRRFAAIATPEYKGSNYSLGFNLAVGWDKFFATLPVTYAVTDLNILQDDAIAIQISPRLGISAVAGGWGTISTFIGATYLKADVTVNGDITFDTSGIDTLNDTSILKFRVDQENADKFNYLIGFNWDIDRNWSIHTEAGFGGSRTNVISSITYRF